MTLNRMIPLNVLLMKHDMLKIHRDVDNAMFALEQDANDDLFIMWYEAGEAEDEGDDELMWNLYFTLAEMLNLA